MVSKSELRKLPNRLPFPVWSNVLTVTGVVWKTSPRRFRSTAGMVSSRNWVVPNVTGGGAAGGGLIRQANQDVHRSLDRQRLAAYYHRIGLAEREWAANNLSRMEELLGRCPEDSRGWERHSLRRLLHGQPPLALCRDATVLGSPSVPTAGRP
jgi:hypothetical protein